MPECVGQAMKSTTVPVERLGISPYPWTALDNGDSSTIVANLAGMPPTEVMRVVGPCRKADASLLKEAPSMYRLLRQMFDEFCTRCTFNNPENGRCERESGCFHPAKAVLDRAAGRTAE